MNDKLSEMKERLESLSSKQITSMDASKKPTKRKLTAKISNSEEFPEERFHGLDFLRAMAMLMGLVFHAPMLYYIPIMADGFQEFGVSSATIPLMEAWLNATVQWLHSWRMTAFFMTSGFFAGLVLSKRTPKQFISDRFVKLGITMILFSAVFDMLDGRFEGKLEHMWFLYYLLLFSCIAWIISTLSSHSKSVTFKQNYKMALTKLILISIALVLVRPIFDHLDGGHVSVATHYHTINLGGLLYFLSWFCAGIWLYSNRFLLAAANSKALTFFSLICATGVFYFILPNLTGVFGFGATKMETQNDAIIFSLLKGLNAVLWASFLTLITHQVMKKSNKILNWLVTLSFPIYIFHLLPCMVLSAILIGMGLSQIQVLIGAVFGAFTVSVVLYYLLIKFTPLSWIILGYKKSWLQPFKKR